MHSNLTYYHYSVTDLGGSALGGHSQLFGIPGVASRGGLGGISIAPGLGAGATSPLSLLQAGGGLPRGFGGMQHGSLLGAASMQSPKFARSPHSHLMPGMSHHQHLAAAGISPGLYGAGLRRPFMKAWSWNWTSPQLTPPLIESHWITTSSVHWFAKLIITTHTLHSIHHSLPPTFLSSDQKTNQTVEFKLVIYQNFFSFNVSFLSTT